MRKSRKNRRTLLVQFFKVRDRDFEEFVVKGEEIWNMLCLN